MPLYRAIATRGYGALPAGGGGGAIASPVLAVADLGDGTGATATITGSESASVDNEVFIGSWSGGTETVTWASEGTRTGNGTVSLTMVPGYYWAYVVSDDGSSFSVSNLVYFRTTSSGLVVLSPTADTYIASTGGNWGTENYLIVGHTYPAGVATNTRALIRFDLSAYSANDIGAAVLRLSLASSNFIEGPHTVYVHKLTTAAWTSSGATWTAASGVLNWTTAGGDYASAPDVQLTVEDGDTELLIDLTELAIENAGGDLNILIKVHDGEDDVTTHNFSAYSYDYATAGDRPKLSITSPSVHMECAYAVQTAIRSLALSGIDTDNVKVRKFPHYRKDLGDTLPLILVTTHLPVTTSPATNLRDDITYPVTISMFAQADADQTSNHGRMLLWREEIRKAFHQSRLTGVNSVWQCNIPSSQPFNEAWFIGGMKDQSPLTLNFISRELRS